MPRLVFVTITVAKPDATNNRHTHDVYLIVDIKHSITNNVRSTFKRSDSFIPPGQCSVQLIVIFLVLAYVGIQRIDSSWL